MGDCGGWGADGETVRVSIDSIRWSLKDLESGALRRITITPLKQQREHRSAKGWNFGRLPRG